MASSEKDPVQKEEGGTQAIHVPVLDDAPDTDGVPHLARGTDEHVGDTHKFARKRDEAAGPKVVVLAILGDRERYTSILEWVQRRGMDVDIASTGAEGLRIH